MLTTRALPGLACALSLLLACTDKGDDTTEGTSSESQTTDGETTDSQPTDAQTTEDEPATDGETGTPAPGCECAEGDPCSVQLCETASLFEDEGEDTGGQDEASLAASLTCALEALRDRKVGRIGWRQESGAGQYDEYGHFEMFGDGTARYTTGGVADICTTIVDAVEVVTLRSPETFAACLEDAAIEERFACLRQARLALQTTCVEGEHDCSGV
ncbi:hypothetical protein [Nannocystis pusilla]|uniref:Lipoprotein n=1 Tax=Nannocystis pusilla TaxID=889268 RepID=A0ABS7TK92_9BACT|nr:hypothetical protein [Nannocystis pusilla]MBZ5708637.1 hypothetical protein [Nannocystis pusilla]